MIYCKNNTIFLFIFLLLAITSCNKTPANSKEKPVVEVEGRVLTVAEMEKVIPKNISTSDSIAFAQNFINQWIKTSLLLRKAELNLTTEEKDVQQILDNYRASLLINKYQQKLLLQKYSPLITNIEIEDYYNKMSENFKLNEDIIQGLFIKVPNTAPNLKLVENWYQSTKPEDLVKLEEYCYQNAKKFDNFLDKWIPISEISNILPKPIPNQSTFIKYNDHYEANDSLFNYYVSIRAYHNADDVAPLNYVEEKVKAILLNKKRLEFIKNLEEELYEEGLKQKIIKFY